MNNYGNIMNALGSNLPFASLIRDTSLPISATSAIVMASGTNFYATSANSSGVTTVDVAPAATMILNGGIPIASGTNLYATSANSSGITTVDVAPAATMIVDEGIPTIQATPSVGPLVPGGPGSNGDPITTPIPMGTYEPDVTGIPVSSGDVMYFPSSGASYASASPETLTIDVDKIAEESSTTIRDPSVTYDVQQLVTEAPSGQPATATSETVVDSSLPRITINTSILSNAQRITEAGENTRTMAEPAATATAPDGREVVTTPTQPAASATCQGGGRDTTPKNPGNSSASPTTADGAKKILADNCRGEDSGLPKLPCHSVGRPKTTTTSSVTAPDGPEVVTSAK